MKRMLKGTEPLSFGGFDYTVKVTAVNRIGKKHRRAFDFGPLDHVTFTAKGLIILVPKKAKP